MHPTPIEVVLSLWWLYHGFSTDHTFIRSSDTVKLVQPLCIIKPSQSHIARSTCSFVERCYELINLVELCYSHSLPSTLNPCSARWTEKLNLDFKIHSGLESLELFALNLLSQKSPQILMNENEWRKSLFTYSFISSSFHLQTPIPRNGNNL